MRSAATPVEDHGCPVRQCLELASRCLRSSWPGGWTPDRQLFLRKLKPAQVFPQEPLQFAHRLFMGLHVAPSEMKLPIDLKSDRAIQAPD
jgi:hypothetical protein